MPIRFFLNMHPSIPSLLLMCKNDIVWDIDTSATDPKSLFLQNFSYFRYIEPFTMTLPNGYKTNATISGIINHFYCSKNLSILWIVTLITFQTNKTWRYVMYVTRVHAAFSLCVNVILFLIFITDSSPSPRHYRLRHIYDSIHK